MAVRSQGRQTILAIVTLASATMLTANMAGRWVDGLRGTHPAYGINRSARNVANKSKNASSVAS